MPSLVRVGLGTGGGNIVALGRAGDDGTAGGVDVVKSQGGVRVGHHVYRPAVQCMPPSVVGHP